MATSKQDKLGKKPRVGRTPDILRKSGAMKDKTKYNRKAIDKILERSYDSQGERD